MTSTSSTVGHLLTVPRSSGCVDWIFTTGEILASTYVEMGSTCTCSQDWRGVKGGNCHQLNPKCTLPVVVFANYIHLPKEDSGVVKYQTGRSGDETDSQEELRGALEVEDLRTLWHSQSLGLHLLDPVGLACAHRHYNS